VRTRKSPYLKKLKPRNFRGENLSSKKCLKRSYVPESSGNRKRGEVQGEGERKKKEKKKKKNVKSFLRRINSKTGAWFLYRKLKKEDEGKEKG